MLRDRTGTIPIRTQKRAGKKWGRVGGAGGWIYDDGQASARHENDQPRCDGKKGNEMREGIKHGQTHARTPSTSHGRRRWGNGCEYIDIYIVLCITSRLKMCETFYTYGRGRVGKKGKVVVQREEERWEEKGHREPRGAARFAHRLLNLEAAEE